MRLPWIAFACALLSLVALRFLLTPDNDPAIWLVPVPGLLLGLGAFRGRGDQRYAVSCLALGVVMDALLLTFLAAPTLVVETLGGLVVVTAPTALVAGTIPVIEATRGRLRPRFGIAGGVVFAIALFVGAFILWRLAAFASP